METDNKIAMQFIPYKVFEDTKEQLYIFIVFPSFSCEFVLFPQVSPFIYHEQAISHPEQVSLLLSSFP